jgi:hypothetical protein
MQLDALHRHTANKIAKLFEEGYRAADYGRDEAVGCNARRNNQCEVFNVHCSDNIH